MVVHIVLRSTCVTTSDLGLFSPRYVSVCNAGRWAYAKMYTNESEAGDDTYGQSPIRNKSLFNHSLQTDGEEHCEEEEECGYGKMPLSRWDLFYARGLTCTQQYVITSLMLLVVAVSILIWDMFCVHVSHNTRATSQKYAIGILVTVQ